MTKVTKQNNDTSSDTGSSPERDSFDATIPEAPSNGLGSKQYDPETGRLLSEIDIHGQETAYDEEESDPMWDFEGSDLFEPPEEEEGD